MYLKYTNIELLTLNDNLHFFLIKNLYHSIGWILSIKMPDYSIPQIKLLFSSY